MVWISSIQELDYYSRNASDFCYCDLLIQPNDLALQGIIGTQTAASTVRIYMYTPDGQTFIDELTIYFDWYTAKVAGRTFFNARLRYFPPVLCDNRCFVLRAVVESGGKTVFDKWTQQYCLADCCSVPEKVLIEGPGVSVGQPKIPTVITSPKDSTCRPLLRIVVRFDCVDNWGGDFWGAPNMTHYINGSIPAPAMFVFSKVLNMAGSILDQPRELTRNISINGTVQRSESKRLYLVQSFEEFPVWKFNEISDMLHASYLEINGDRYNFPGGTPFETLYPKRLNKRYFRLNMTVEDFLIFQNFNCGGQPCDVGSKVKYYAFEKEADTYYTDSGLEIGDYEDVLTWFETSGGGLVTPAGPGTGGELSVVNEPWKVRVVDAEAGDLTVDYFHILEVEGSNLPAYIYGDSTRPADRIYAQDLINEDYNSLFGVDPNYVACKVPIAGVPSFSDMICNTPVAGVVEYIDLCQKPVIGTIVYGDLDEEPPISLTEFILAENGDRLITEGGDPIIQE